jgi:hypothetical protein
MLLKKYSLLLFFASPDISTLKTGVIIEFTFDFEIDNGSIFYALIEEFPD